MELPCSLLFDVISIFSTLQDEFDIATKLYFNEWVIWSRIGEKLMILQRNNKLCKVNELRFLWHWSRPTCIMEIISLITITCDMRVITRRAEPEWCVTGHLYPNCTRLYMIGQICIFIKIKDNCKTFSSWAVFLAAIRWPVFLYAVFQRQPCH